MYQEGFLSEVKSCATERCPTPPGPEGSNGQHTVLCDAEKLDLFLFWSVASTSLAGKSPRPFRRRFTRVKNDGPIHMMFISFHFYLLAIVARLRDGIVDGHGEQSFGRSVTQLRRVLVPGGTTPRRHGHVPVRLEALWYSRHAQRLRWNMYPYEKRNCYQLDGERASYRHS